MAITIPTPAIILFRILYFFIKVKKILEWKRVLNQLIIFGSLNGF